jgi:hypothetical protein
VSRLNPEEQCPFRKNYQSHRIHVVTPVGDFGRGLGYGYECTTCWRQWTRVGRRLVEGWPDPDLESIDETE